MMRLKIPTQLSKDKPSPSKEQNHELELKDLDPTQIPKNRKEKILEIDKIDNLEKEPEDLNNKDPENLELMSPEKNPTPFLLET